MEPVVLLVFLLMVVVLPAVLVVVEVVVGDLANWHWLQGSLRLGRAVHFSCKLPS